MTDTDFIRTCVEKALGEVDATKQLPTQVQAELSNKMCNYMDASIKASELRAETIITDALALVDQLLGDLRELTAATRSAIDNTIE